MTRKKNLKVTARYDKVGKFTFTAFIKTFCKPYSNWKSHPEKAGIEVFQLTQGYISHGLP